MTPPAGFLRRLFGSTDKPTASEPSAPSGGRPAPRADSPTDDDPPARRRRGTRGGRKRRSGDSPAAESTPPAASARTTTREPRESRGRDAGGRASSNGRSASPNGKASSSKDTGGNTPSGEQRGYRWGRRVEGDEARVRGEEASRRRRFARTQRGNLDAPLPEDIAFRSGDEGGDRSLLPSRRRRPTGMHDTNRVLVGGARTIGTSIRRDDVIVRRPESAPDAPYDDEPEQDDETPLPDSLIDTTDDDTDAEETPAKRRRRGRRGGRGRRRPDGATEASDSAEEHDDTEDGADDEDEAPAAIEPEAEADDEPVERERPTRTRRRSAAAPSRAEVDPSTWPATFAALGATERSLVALAGFGFEQPSPIQEQAIPVLMNGLDVVGIAQTGSGKTVAFGVPMVERLDRDIAEVQAIVLVPTRELAQQVLEVLTELGRHTGLQAVGLLGGHSLQKDFQALERRPHIVVGTPGRILDHLSRGTLSLRHVSYAVLDEADQMLDIGFLPDIRRILSRTPQRRQTALFSATMPGTIRRLIWQFMQDPETISVTAESTTVDSIEQVYMEVASRDKVRGLRELVERELRGRTLIFCNMKRRVDNLEHDLARDGVKVGALHGDMDQKQRDRVVQRFREGALDVLIATNVAARGLDIPEITHVVNYDVPQNPEEYVHRIGRTGRAGREGKAITFVSEWDMDAFDQIHAKFSDRLRKEDLDLYRPATASTPDASAS